MQILLDSYVANVGLYCMCHICEEASSARQTLRDTVHLLGATSTLNDTFPGVSLDSLRSHCLIILPSGLLKTNSFKPLSLFAFPVLCYLLKDWKIFFGTAY